MGAAPMMGAFGKNAINVNEQTANETIQRLYANLEENDMSDTGGNDQNPDWLEGKKNNQLP